jgi:hypothetical protein
MINANAADVKYEDGETWTYEVKGSRPWFPGDINGDRVIEIVKVSDDGFEAEEEWGNGGNGPAVVTLNKEGLQTKLEVGEFVMEYESPIPFQYNDLLEAEKEKEFGKFESDNGQFKMSMTTKVKREKNEDITVPAGEFKGCQHYIVTNVFTFDGDQGTNSREMVRHIWAHPNVNGAVKDSYEFESFAPDAGDEKIKGEALLKKHEIVKR